MRGWRRSTQLRGHRRSRQRSTKRAARRAAAPAASMESFAPDFAFDEGAQLVNTDHADLLAMIRRFHLTMVDRHAFEPERAAPDQARRRRRISEDRLATALRGIAARIAADCRAGSTPIMPMSRARLEQLNGQGLSRPARPSPRRCPRHAAKPGSAPNSAPSPTRFGTRADLQPADRRRAPRHPALQVRRALSDLRRHRPGRQGASPPSIAAMSSSTSGSSRIDLGDRFRPPGLRRRRARRRGPRPSWRCRRRCCTASHHRADCRRCWRAFHRRRRSWAGTRK